MRKLLLVLMLVGLTNPLMAQDPIMLSEVMIGGTNYKYLNEVDYTEAPMPVRILERKAAEFKAEGHDLFVDEFGTYAVSFFIPEGRVVALYNDKGEIIKTVERYKDVQLPDDVQYALITEYPDWEVVKDIYHVKFNHKKGVDKYFVVRLKKGDKSLRLKIDDQGNYL